MSILAAPAAFADDAKSSSTNVKNETQVLQTKDNKTKDQNTAQSEQGFLYKIKSYFSQKGTQDKPVSN